MGDNEKWWWPKRGKWPTGIPRETTIEAFIKAFSTRGYEVCADGDPNANKEKIALFADGTKPTHAARLLPNGTWTSKLGQNIDISHNISDLDGPAYGEIVMFFPARYRVACFFLPRKLLVFHPCRLQCVRPKSPNLIFLIIRKVAFEPFYVGFALKREDVRANPI